MIRQLSLFLAKRIVAAAAMLLVVSFLVFSLLAASPGSEITTLLGARPASPELIAALKHEHHLDEPFLVQYGRWLASAARFDFGRSITTEARVTRLIRERVPVSLQLAGFALALVILVGIPAGFAAGVKRGRAADRVISVVAVLGMSAPPFAISLVLVYGLGVSAGWFPVFGAGTGVADRAWHLTLPAIALAIGLSALVVRQTRAAALDVMNRDYLTFARARGLPQARVVSQYALRNVALPIINSAGLVLVVALSGAVLVEVVFSLPGVGSLVVESVRTKDVPVVQGLAMFTAVYVIAVNLLVDLVGLAVDPRLRHAALR